MNPSPEVEHDAAAEALDLDRFSATSKRWLTGGLSVAMIVAFVVGWPLVWRLLDTSELTDTGLYTGAYLSSILPFLMMGVLYLGWIRRHAVTDRLPTPAVIGLGVLFALQLASIASAWGDQYTGDAIDEALQRTGISFWGRGVIERAWYAGYAAQVATGLLALAVTPLSAVARWRTFAAAWPVVIAAVWFVLANPYIGWM